MRAVTPVVWRASDLETSGYGVIQQYMPFFDLARGSPY